MTGWLPQFPHLKVFYVVYVCHNIFLYIVSLFSRIFCRNQFSTFSSIYLGFERSFSLSGISFLCRSHVIYSSIMFSATFVSCLVYNVIQLAPCILSQLRLLAGYGRHSCEYDLSAVIILNVYPLQIVGNHGFVLASSRHVGTVDICRLCRHLVTVVLMVFSWHLQSLAPFIGLVGAKGVSSQCCKCISCQIHIYAISLPCCLSCLCSVSGLLVQPFLNYVSIISRQFILSSIYPRYQTPFHIIYISTFGLCYWKPSIQKQTLFLLYCKTTRALELFVLCC